MSNRKILFNSNDFTNTKSQKLYGYIYNNNKMKSSQKSNDFDDHIENRIKNIYQ